MLEKVSEERATVALEVIAEQLQSLAEATAFAGPLEAFWLSYTGILIAAVGAFFAWRQLRALRLQIASETERQKRLLAVNVLKDYKKDFRAEFTSLEHIAKWLSSDENFKTLHNPKTELKVPEQSIGEHIEDVLSAMGSNEAVIKEDSILTRLQKKNLTEVFADYANFIENSLIALSADIADREMILKQLRPVVSGDTAKYFWPIWEYYGEKYIPNTISVTTEERNRELRQDTSCQEPIHPYVRRAAFLESLNERRFKPIIWPSK